MLASQLEGPQKSRYMDVHEKKGVNLSPDQQNEIMGRYLTMKHKTAFKHLKKELDGLREERDNAGLENQDKKRSKIYSTEELTIMRMQNNEYRKKIKAKELENASLLDKRVLLAS